MKKTRGFTQSGQLIVSTIRWWRKQGTFIQSGQLIVSTTGYWWSVPEGNKRCSLNLVTWPLIQPNIGGPLLELKHGGFYSEGFLCYLAINHHSFYVGRNVPLDLILFFHLLFVGRNLTKKQNLDQQEPCLACQHYIQFIQKYFAWQLRSAALELDIAR